MKRWCCLLIALTAGVANAATVWKWVDENGVTHYSDRPVEGAEVIELSAAPSVSLPTPQPATRPSVGPAREREPASRTQGASQAYTYLEVASPAPQETLWNLEGTLAVSVAVEPALQAGHSFDVYLDGQRQNLAATSPSFTVPEVWRGVHTLQAVIVGEAGNEIMRSRSITFTVQQTSLLNPNNPNSPAATN